MQAIACWSCNATQNSDTELKRCVGCHTAKYCTPECQRADWIKDFGHKRFCRDIRNATDKASVWVVVLSGDSTLGLSDALLAALHKRYYVRVLEDSKTLEDWLQPGVYYRPESILLLDAVVAMTKHARLRMLLRDFVRSGGYLCHAGQFAGSVTPDRFKKYMQTSFDLPWTYGAYSRSTFSLNPGSLHSYGDTIPPVFPSESNVKAVQFGEVDSAGRLYSARNGVRSQSMVFAPEPMDEKLAAVCYAKVGEGFVSLLGDVVRSFLSRYLPI